MKSKPTNSKKVNLKFQDLMTVKDPRGGVKVTRPSRDGLTNNHNELYLAEVSQQKVNLKLKDLTSVKDPRGGVKVNRPSRDGLMFNHN